MLNKKIDASSLKFSTRKSCPVCGNEQYSNVIKLDYESQEIKRFLIQYYGEYFEQFTTEELFHVVKCNLCDLMYQNCILDSKSLDYFYDHVIDANTSLAKRERANAVVFDSLIKDAQIAIKLLNAKKPRDISALDFGMGWGHWAVAARATGLTVSGAELSEKRIKFAQKMGVNVVNLDDCIVDQFDYINTDQVFEHLEEPFQVLFKLTQCLKVGGIIKIFVPNRTGDLLKMRLKHWSVGKDAFHPLEHINSFNSVSLNNLAEKCDLIPLRSSVLLKTGLFGFERVFKRKFFSAPSWYFRKVR